MSQNKMLKAYRTLLNHAKERALMAEYQTWQSLGHAIERAEQAEHNLAELTQKEFHQVQEDLRADLNTLAEYLADIEQGAADFVRMELEPLEQLLIDKALSLADPTQITVLRLRLAAAMEENHPAFSTHH